MKQINDWQPEVKSLLDALVAVGCTLLTGDNGEEQFEFNGDQAKFIENLIACDEASFSVRTPGGHLCWIWIVLGNSPGELVSDYHVDALLDAVTGAHHDKWYGQPQPKKDFPA